MQGHGGILATEVMRKWGIDTIFTLSGGHIFPFYDGAVKAGDVKILDVRHEQTAAFAAEGYSKLTRKPGIAALTAGPGVTNGMSAITSAWFNGSPLVVLGGRAPQLRWGQGSLQEFDHIPIVAPITKSAVTVTDTASIPKVLNDLLATAVAPHRGPVFADFPLDVLFVPGESEITGPGAPVKVEPDPDDIAKIAKALSDATNPVLIAGSDVYWNESWEAMTSLVEKGRIPTFTNGMGRGTLPADHELSFSRARSLALKGADLVLVVGTPLDFRLGFGKFGEAKVVHVMDTAEAIARHVPLAASASGDLASIFTGIADALEPADTSAWIERLADDEAAKRASDDDELSSAASPILPSRIYGELKKRLDRDAIVICDGGDFVSYAGRYVDVYTPGAWMDPGPYGCLGTGAGYAMAARSVYPDRQVVVLYGDGAFGFSGMDFDSLIRFGLPVVGVIGNNGIWGLEKHPMRSVYGYDVAADLQPGCRYDKVVEDLGGYGELVESPDEIGPAIDRAFEAGVPAIVNVLTDPEHAYPRSSNLA